MDPEVHLDLKSKHVLLIVICIKNVVWFWSYLNLRAQEKMHLTLELTKWFAPFKCLFYAYERYAKSFAYICFLKENTYG